MQFIHYLFIVESRGTLLSRELKSNLFKLFSGWSEPLSMNERDLNGDEIKLQLSALQVG